MAKATDDSQTGAQPGGIMAMMMGAIGFGGSSRSTQATPESDVTPASQLVEGQVEPPAPIDLLQQAQSMAKRLPAQVIDAVDAALAYATFDWIKPDSMEAQQVNNAFGGQLTPMGSPSASVAARIRAGEYEMA